MEISPVWQSVESLYDHCRKSWASALWQDGPTGAEFWRGLVRSDGANGRGSYVPGLNTMFATLRLLALLPFKEITDTVFPGVRQTGHRYFQAMLPDGKSGRLGVVSVSAARELGLCIRKRAGAHGDELTAAFGGPLPTTQVVSAIMEQDRLVTWYPGPIWGSIPARFTGSPEDWGGGWPVKLIPLEST